jgi:hypothetical protein
VLGLLSQGNDEPFAHAFGSSLPVDNRPNTTYVGSSPMSTSGIEISGFWKKLNNYVLPSFISVQSFFAMIFNKTVDIKFSAHDEFLK